MSLDELQRNWHELGQDAPLETILCPSVPGQKWDIDAFFASGEAEVAQLVDYLNSQGLGLPKGSALDFGCGIGRVTQPLCRHFQMCYGVDIAPSILELARQHNAYGDRCRYILNKSPRLDIFPDSSIDFVYSMITLQNIAPRYSAGYILEFVRILAPGGLLVFQIPNKPTTLRTAIKQWLPYPLLQAFYALKYRGQPHLELHGISQRRVIRLLEGNGGKILDIQPFQRADIGWSSHRYCVTKQSHSQLTTPLE